MSDETSHVSRTVEDIKRQVAAKLEELRSLVATMNTLEDMVGVPRTQLAEMAALIVTTSPSAVATFTNGSSSTRRAVTIRPDEFMGDGPLEAAKKYIASVGHAVDFDEIADAVSKGGAAIRGSDWRERLETSLIRSVYEVVKVREKTYGLTKFYSEEQIKRLRGSRGRFAEPSSKKGRGRRKTGKGQRPRRDPRKPAANRKDQAPTPISGGTEAEHVTKGGKP